MQRVKTATAVTSRPAYTETGAPGYFTSGDAVAAIPATVPGAQWFNQVQEELLNAIKAGGLTPDATKDDQLAQAIAALIAAQTVTIGEASETVAGIIKLATQAMVDAGADGKAAVTPATLAGRLAALLTAHNAAADAHDGRIAWAGPVGTVAFFAMSAPPAGWLKANGAAVSRTAYAELFAAIGTVFGAGDGSATFALPDLRGEFLRGWSDDRAVDSGRALGSWQKGSVVGYDLDGSPNAHISLAGLPTNVGVETPTLTDYPSVWNCAGSENFASITTLTAGVVRPRNVALLACIKYS